MPELPDLVRIENELRRTVVGRRIRAARRGDPITLRIMAPLPFPEALAGRTLVDVARRGHFMRFDLGPDLALVVNAMLAGRYHLSAAGTPRRPDAKALSFALAFDDGQELRFVDDRRMAKVYVVAPADEASIPAYGRLGADVLAPDFTLERFRALAGKRRDQVRPFLMDKSALASIGNAYADEILWRARIHPKTFVRKLAPAAIDALHAAVGDVLSEAVATIERRAEPIDVKVRDFLAVRGQAGRPCPRCATTIRAVRVGKGDACFCPACQPATRALFVDFGRLARVSDAAGQVRKGPRTRRKK